MKGYVLAIGDTHTSHNLGLLNPATTITVEKPNGEFEEQEVTLNPYQDYLWYDIYIPALKEVKKITEGEKMVAIHGGDWGQGNKFTAQTKYLSEANQVTMAVDVMKPILDVPACVKARFSAGTGAHDFTEHSLTLLGVKFLQHEYPQIDIKANYQGLADVCGLSIDYAHHGPGEGLRIYLNGNNVRFYLSDLMIRYLSKDKKTPKLVLRWHVHGNQDEFFTLGNYKSRILVIPSMCGMSFHARKATRTKMSVTNGFALFEITDGVITNNWKFYRENDLSTKETLL
jgi:hypothetical protein